MKSTKCVECGFVGWSDIENCKACGASLRQRSTSLPPASPTYNTHHEYRNEQEGPEKGLAVAALILGILSFFTFSLLIVGAILGIVLAVKAMGRVTREPWRYGGRSLAIAGLILSIVSLTTVPMGGIVAAIAIPNLLASARAANEASAINSLRTIASAESIYQSTAGNGKYGTLEELAANRLIDPKLGSGVKNGYNFAVTLDSENPEAFEVTGVPTTYRTSGMRSFYVDQTFVIRGGDNSGGPSTKMDEPLDPEPAFGNGARRIEYVPAPAN